MLARFSLALLTLAALLLPACGRAVPLVPKTQTWPELRVVRRAITVTPPDEKTREPYPRERLVDGQRIDIDPTGLAWIRRDAGATLLVRGPAQLTLRKDRIDLQKGRAFIDSPSAETTLLQTPHGPLHLAHVRASIDVTEQGTTDAYVLSGEVRTSGAAHASAGETLHLDKDNTTVTPALTWEDWTGGLGTTDRSAEPAPYGVGTVGARAPGEQGKPRFPLAIQKLDLRVTIDHDFALTEVDQTFFNPSSDTVEGIYRFRAPPGAVLHRFGVDREGVVVWGRVKEKQAAAAQYQANVYQGSKEDPALLEWDAPGAYRARLYPIGPGESRRVVVRYAEWLGRAGKNGERRLYIYPMAAEGKEGTLPLIEDLFAQFNLGRAGAREIRAGMMGVRQGNTLTVRAHDFTPRADLALELFDDGLKAPAAYRAPHTLDPDTIPIADREQALRRAATEADYLLVELRPDDLPALEQQGNRGLDLAIVVDTSAATQTGSLAIARAATAALLAHTGPNDRVALWTGDTTLRPILDDHPGLAALDDAARRRTLAALAAAPRGGATDLGAMLADAAAALDPARRGAIVYIGDGAPTVGESSLADLRARLAKLPRPVRIFGLGVGDDADLAVLEGLARGAFAERIADASSAARASLRVLEHAERPAWLGASVDLGPMVERVYPRDIGAIVSGESVLVIGRISGSARPSSLTIAGPGTAPRVLPIQVEPIDDHGDLSQRWAGGRLAELMDEGAGRAAMVDLGVRHGIITPFTSLYVPTKNEMSAEERNLLAQRKDEIRRRAFRWTVNRDDAPIEGDGRSHDRVEAEMAELQSALKAQESEAEALANELARASDEATRSRLTAQLDQAQQRLSNAPMVGGKPASKPSPVHCGPSDASCSGFDGAPAANKELAPVAAPSVAAVAAPIVPAATATAPVVMGGETTTTTPTDSSTETTGDTFGAGGFGLSGISEGGGGLGDGIGLGDIGTIGHGIGQGFGSGHGRLGGAHRSSPPKIRMGEMVVSGRLPPEVIRRIVRQNFGRFRLCYENGLRNNPNLQGRVATRFIIGRDGMVGLVQNGGSDMPDSGVVACVVRAYNGLSFPMPEDGTVSVVSPIMFSPGGGDPSPHEARAKASPEREDDDSNKREPASKTAPRSAITIRIDEPPHRAFYCGAAAALPFEDKVAIWRERLARLAGSPDAIAIMYANALRACEAPTFRERARLAALMLDALPRVRDRVTLWRRLFDDTSAADLVYRGLVARVRTPAERRELHAALGLSAMDPGALDKLVNEAKTPEERARRLRKAAFEWPDDFAVAMRLLDALEDAGDVAGARGLARALRARPDADAALRTAVGELYLRLAARAPSSDDKANDEREARRAFGEIVEMAPDDPVARKRLGDLLRAHGFYADAARQYETLARLAPDDTRVPLLLSAAAAGQGFLESAVKWAEKASAASAPDEAGSAAARAFAATYLAWGHLDAEAAGRKGEAKAIETRLDRVLAADRGRLTRGARVVLTWAHPDLHPTLWHNAFGSPMPAPDGDASLGIALAVVPARDDIAVEVRLDKSELEHAARLGAEAVLTVMFADTTRAARIPLTFTKAGPTKRRFAIRGGAVDELKE